VHEADFLCTRRIFLHKSVFFGANYGLIFFHIGMKLTKLERGIKGNSRTFQAFLSASTVSQGLDFENFVSISD
jgi:hypothetical protein